MNSTDLSFFSAVATAGGIGRAALELNTVQSNVTQRIKALEARLGVKLFERSKTGVVLTSVGRQLAPYALRVAELLSEAQRVMKERGEAGGELRIGCLETTAALRLPAIVKAFTSAHPTVDLDIETGPTRDLTERVLARQLDGAFVSGPVRHAELVAVPMIREDLVLIAAPHVGTRKQLLALVASGAAKALVFRAGCSYRQRTTEVLARLGCVTVRWMEMGTLDGIIGCVAGGVGVALLPRSVVAAAASEGIVSLHAVGAKEGGAETVFVSRKEALVPRALRDFVDTAAATLADLASAPPYRRISARTASIVAPTSTMKAEIQNHSKSTMTAPSEP